MIEEVTSLSSDSEPLSQLKVRRVTRKVSFSHPLAHQDPQFLLKQQVHESRRHTRARKDADLSAGLPDATRKRRTEVFFTCTLFIRWRVLSVSHSTLLTPIIRRPPPLRVTPCSQVCWPSRLHPGNNNLLTLSVCIYSLYA